MKNFESLKNELLDKISEAEGLDSLNKIKIDFLGKKGFISGEMKKLGAMEPEERKIFGATINSFRDFITNALSEKQEELSNKALELKLKSEKIDITIPDRGNLAAKSHPITHTIEEVISIFSKMGFKAVDGPEIEDDWHNFTGLNIPKMHPARQMHDTFYIEGQEGNLLRTHTSSVQLRYMKSVAPPVKIISMGRVYRSDFDSTHTPMFHQVEGLYIDKETNFGHLKWCISEFLKAYFNLKEVPMRLRPSYFPFTEPSAEVDIRCTKGKEIKIGEGQDWMEIMGCGMVNSQVLENMGIDPKKYQGFAFGMGIERITMLKHNIHDLRFFFENDMRWLSRYGF